MLIRPHAETGFARYSVQAAQQIIRGIAARLVQSIHLTDEPGADIVRVLLLLLLITWVLGQVALL